MKLQVEQAKEQVGKHFSYAYTVPALTLGEDVAAFPWSHHDITANGEYWYDGQHFIVQGIIKRIGDYDCTRCLEQTTVNDNIDFEEIFGVEDFDASEESTISYCDGIEIELTDLIRETLIINEPSQVLCQEDCKGLCVHCGTNLNVSDCTCDSFVVDPRLAVLKTLLEKMDD